MNKPNRSKYYDSNHNSSLLNLPVMRAAYSDRTAWLMARCSELAYVEFEAGQEQQLRDSLKELGLEFVRGFSRDATCACLARNDPFAVLAFRGTTQDYRNILTDMDIRFTALNPARASPMDSAKPKLSYNTISPQPSPRSPS